MEKRIWLFGAGRNGKKALSYLIDHGYGDYVTAFIDNNAVKVKNTICDKEIVTLVEAEKSIKIDDVILITPDMESAVEIAKQLNELNIVKYLYWARIEKLEWERVKGLMEETNPYKVQAYSTQQTADLFYEQAQFLIAHTDASTMKPATGVLRDHQMQLISLAVDFFSVIKDLDIKPFLEGGNLLGFVRHGGFIPWDDDLDLTLIRSEFERLKSFLKEHLVYEKYEGSSDNYYIDKWQDLMIQKHPNTMLVLETPLRLRIHRGKGGASWREYPFLDLIPLDEYRRDMKYQDQIDFLNAIEKELVNIETAELQRIYLQDKMKEDIEQHQGDGGVFAYGLDSLEGYYNRNLRWHVRENIFPLQSIVYEGVLFWVPSHPKEYLEEEFNNIIYLPKNAALHVHR